MLHLPPHSQRQGLEATGILANVAKTAGFGSVSELLVQNPNAKALSMFKREGPQEGDAVAGVPVKRVRRETAAAPALELLDDSLLGERDTPLPVRLVDEYGEAQVMPGYCAKGFFPLVGKCASTE